MKYTVWPVFCDDSGNCMPIKSPGTGLRPNLYTIYRVDSNGNETAVVDYVDPTQAQIACMQLNNTISKHVKTLIYA